MNELHPHETKIVRGWTIVEGKTVADGASRRIKALTAGPLVKIASTADGWGAVYRDPRDGRTWKLTLPSSGAHGGGPTTLECISTPLDADSVE